MADEIFVDVDAVITSGKDFEVSLLVKKPTTPADVELTLSVNGVARSFELKIGGMTSPANVVQKITVGSVIDWTVSNWGTATSGQQVVMEAKEIGGTRHAKDFGTVV
jgi:hypothetical protein